MDRYDKRYFVYGALAGIIAVLFSACVTRAYGECHWDASLSAYVCDGGVSGVPPRR